LQTARLRQECLDAQSRGLQCDENATTAAIIAVRRDTLDLVSLHCEEQDAIALGYLSADFDLPADIIRFCREWETISSSAAFGPVLAAGGSLEPADQACVAATASTVAKLAQVTFDAWRATMNRIAVRSWNLDSKNAMIDHCSARVDGFEPDAVRALLGVCEASRFEAIYHRGAAEFVADVVTRANCFPWAFYLQDKLTCPESVCGNWIIEPGETCDDGNTAGGDACDAECLGL
jgi:cysteine-rich repeat protein